MSRKDQTTRIFTKKISNLVYELENYISLHELLESGSKTIHKENILANIKKIEEEQFKSDPLRLPTAFDLHVTEMGEKNDTRSNTKRTSNNW